MTTMRTLAPGIGGIPPRIPQYYPYSMATDTPFLERTVNQQQQPSALLDPWKNSSQTSRTFDLMITEPSRKNFAELRLAPNLGLQVVL